MLVCSVVIIVFVCLFVDVCILWCMDSNVVLESHVVYFCCSCESG